MGKNGNAIQGFGPRLNLSPVHATHHTVNIVSTRIGAWNDVL